MLLASQQRPAAGGRDRTPKKGSKLKSFHSQQVCLDFAVLPPHAHMGPVASAWRATPCVHCGSTRFSRACCAQAITKAINKQNEEAAAGAADAAGGRLNVVCFHAGLCMHGARSRCRAVPCGIVARKASSEVCGIARIRLGTGEAKGAGPTMRDSYIRLPRIILRMRHLCVVPAHVCNQHGTQTPTARYAQDASAVLHEARSSNTQSYVASHLGPGDRVVHSERNVTLPVVPVPVQVRATAKPAAAKQSKATRSSKTAALAAKATKSQFVL